MLRPSPGAVRTRWKDRILKRRKTIPGLELCTDNGIRGRLLLTGNKIVYEGRHRDVMPQCLRIEILAVSLYLKYLHKSSVIFNCTCQPI
jgi:hypothetical protein